ncbi:hypothetical protein ACLKA6_012534 [Drosophila palustris]
MSALGWHRYQAQAQAQGGGFALNFVVSWESISVSLANEPFSCSSKCQQVGSRSAFGNETPSGWAQITDRRASRLRFGWREVTL